MFDAVVEGLLASPQFLSLSRLSCSDTLVARLDSELVDAGGFMSSLHTSRPLSTYREYIWRDIISVSAILPPSLPRFVETCDI